MYILALESSTTSAKAMVYNTENSQFMVRSHPYTMENADVTTHDAEAVLRQTVALGRELSKGKKIDMVVLGGTWHSIMLCDKEMNPKTPVYLWSYTGASEICRELREDQAYVNNFYKKTGCMVNAIYPFFKIKLFEKMGYKLEDYLFVGQGTYNNYRLTGQRAVTDCIASGTGLLNIHTKQYDEELIKELGIQLEQLPELITYKDALALDEEGAKLLGLPIGTPVIATASDGGLNQVGCGALEEGIMSFSIGTSSAIRMSTSKPVIPENPSTWCYYSPKMWLSGAATSGSCNCIDWFKTKAFPEGTTYQDIEEGINYESETPVFLPFIFGERCPGWDDEKQGGFFSLQPHHTSYDMYHSIQEGVLFNIYQCYEVLTQLNGVPKKIKLSGGILKSEKWAQMCANIFQTDMHIDKAEHSSVLGSVALGMELLGVINDAKDMTFESDAVIHPQLDEIEKYQLKYNKYKKWYQKMQ